MQLVNSTQQYIGSPNEIKSLGPFLEEKGVISIMEQHADTWQQGMEGTNTKNSYHGRNKHVL
jgi:hypothetical protein